MIMEQKLMGPRIEGLNIFVISGMGGCGKTQMLSYFVQKHRTRYVRNPSVQSLTDCRSFEYIFFIDASTESNIKTDLRDAIRSVDGHQQSTYQDALSFLENHTDSVLIFDNADDPNLDLLQFFPNPYNGIILITSRLRTLGELATLHHLQLSAMPHKEAVEALVKASRRALPLAPQDVPPIDILVEELGCLALALVQAGVYIFNMASVVTQETRTSVFEQYLDLFRREREVLLRRGGSISIDRYKRSLYSSLDLSYTMLPPLTREFLHLCSQLHYTSVSVSMLLEATKCDFEDSTEYLERPESYKEIQGKLRALFRPTGTWNEVHIYDIVQSLSSFSLAETTVVNETVLLQFHPLVHAWAQETLGAESHSLYMKMAITVVSSSERSLPQSHVQYLPPHIIGFLGKISLGNLHPRDMMKFGGILVDHGFGKMGVELHEEGAWKIEKEAGVEDKQTLDGYMILGNTYRKVGRFKEAEVLETKMLETRSKLFGERHLDTISASENLASTYRNLGKLKEAEELQTSALEMRREVLGDGHLKTLTASSNLALIYRDLGKLKEAEELQTSVLAMRREVLEERHPEMIRASNNLAITYYNLGKLKEAEELQKNILEIRQEILGKRHPHTINAFNNLALTYRRLGELRRAEELQTSVLAMRREILGERHRDTLSASCNLSITYYDLGKLKEAEELQTDVLAMRQEILGERHPDTINTFSILAIFYHRLGRLTEAKELGEKAQELAYIVLGQDHPLSREITRTLNRIRTDIEVLDKGQLTDETKPT
jgi:tetratricopeptide (TPR) repeat protein